MKTFDDTIACAAWQVLSGERKPMEIDEILSAIVSRGLYKFNTPEPKTVLREQMRRHCKGLARNLGCDPVMFVQKADGRYEASMETSSAQRKAQGRRIQRATDKEETIKFLIQSPQSPFNEIWALMLFAAMLGYNENKREPLKAVDTGKGIDLRYFSNSPAWPGVLYLLALVVTNEAEALTGEPEREEARTVLFEEYANGGLAILHSSLESSGYNLDSISQLVAKYIGGTETPENVLAEVTI